MTDFLPYTTGEYAVDAPATALHFERWFRNWEAGFEGAPGAPRLCVGALQRLNPGAVVRLRADATKVAAAGSVTFVAIGCQFLQVGTVRLTFVHTGGGSSSVVRIRSGVFTTLATFSNTGSWVARSVDAPVLPGDELLVQIASSVASAASIRNARMQTNGEDYFPVGVSAGDLEGNTYA